MAGGRRSSGPPQIRDLNDSFVVSRVWAASAFRRGIVAWLWLPGKGPRSGRLSVGMVFHLAPELTEVVGQLPVRVVSHLIGLDPHSVDVGIFELLDRLSGYALDEPQIPAALGDPGAQLALVVRHDRGEAFHEPVDVGDVSGDQIDRVLLAIDGQRDAVAVFDDPPLGRDLDALLCGAGVLEVRRVGDDRCREGNARRAPKREAALKPRCARLGQSLGFHPCLRSPLVMTYAAGTTAGYWLVRASASSCQTHEPP